MTEFQLADTSSRKLEVCIGLGHGTKDDALCSSHLHPGWMQNYVFISMVLLCKHEYTRLDKKNEGVLTYCLQNMACEMFELLSKYSRRDEALT